MKFLAIPAVIVGLLQAAQAQPSGTNAYACDAQGLAGQAVCLGTDTVVFTDADIAPLSDAAVEWRNPIAPQSNYTAKTIEDDGVFAAQVVLRKNGCYEGRLDGVLAEGTEYAIKLFEANMGMVPTGQLSAETQTALRQSHNRFDICR